VRFAGTNGRFLAAVTSIVLVVALAVVVDVVAPAVSASTVQAAEAGAGAATFSVGGITIVPPIGEVTPRTGSPTSAAPAAPRGPELVSAVPQNRPGTPAQLPDRRRLYLGNYFPWYEPETLTGAKTSDRPIEPYDNEDERVLRRHIQEARAAGLDGFVSTWIIAKDRTDRNLGRLLSLSLGQDFRISVSYLSNALPDPTQAGIIADLRYILANYGAHPNYLRHEGKPVIVFNNLSRVPMANGRMCASRQQCIQAWKEIRDQVEPYFPSFWMGEGLDFQYLDVFDGIYLIKVTHRVAPNDYVRAPTWARAARAAAASTGKPKLWMATVMPGWDDTKTEGAAFDLREAAPTFRRDREDGRFFAATWEAALQSQPDWVLLNSFNEWAEGTQIEPSPTYGNRYLEISRQWAERFKSGS
jgi:hypothetical protein